MRPASTDWVPSLGLEVVGTRPDWAGLVAWIVIDDVLLRAVVRMQEDDQLSRPGQGVVFGFL